MKKFLALIMALVLVFALCACGSTEGAESGDEVIEEVVVVSSGISGTDASSNAPTTPQAPVSSQGATSCAHKNVNVTPAVAATCSAEGKTEGKTCKDCGAVVTAVTKIPMKDHTFAPATAEKPATCTVCGVTKGNAIEPTALPAFINNPTTEIAGCKITCSIKEVKYVENKTKSNIIYTVKIENNGTRPQSFAWTIDISTGDQGSALDSGFEASTPSSVAPGETFTQDFETGPVRLTSHFGYALDFNF